MDENCDFLEHFMDDAVICYRATEETRAFILEQKRKLANETQLLKNSLSSEQLALFDNYIKTLSRLVFYKYKEYYYKGFDAKK